MRRSQTNQPAGTIIDRLAQFVDLLNQARDFHARARLTPFVRLAMEEFPFIGTIVLQPPATIIAQLKLFAPTVAAKIINEAEAEKLIAGVQERLRQPRVEFLELKLWRPDDFYNSGVFRCSLHGKFIVDESRLVDNYAFDQPCPGCNPLAYKRSAAKLSGGGE
jgi:hypothetical protein